MEHIIILLLIFGLIEFINGLIIGMWLMGNLIKHNYIKIK